jgi:transposase-like protein
MIPMEKPRKGSKEGLPPTYPESFKIAVAREYLSGQLSYSQLARKHGLPGPDTPRHFVRWYKQWLAHHEIEEQAESKAVDQGRDDLGELQKQLYEANLKITALEMMISNAEQELEVSIRKKSGTKRFAK